MNDELAELLEPRIHRRMLGMRRWRGGACGVTPGEIFMLGCELGEGGPVEIGQAAVLAHDVHHEGEAAAELGDARLVGVIVAPSTDGCAPAVVGVSPIHSDDLEENHQENNY